MTKRQVNTRLIPESFNDIQLTVTCRKCGTELTEKVRRIKTSKDILCVECGNIIPFFHEHYSGLIEQQWWFGRLAERKS